jgi:hypothetical protein
MLQVGRSQVRDPMGVNEFFQFTKSFRPHQASNGNEYQKQKNNVTAIYEPTV